MPPSAAESTVLIRNRGDAPPAWSWWLVFTLAALGAWAMTYSAPYLDTVRDVYWAERIALGAEWPLVGPEIGFFTHLGPAWFYLLAPALWISPSITAAAAWTGILAGLKYPLALALGARLGSWRMGFFFAMLLALPTLATFTHLTFSHFNLVEAAVLAFALAAAAHWQNPRRWLALVAGLAFSLALHAHPTVIALGWGLVILAWGVARRDWREAALQALLMAAGAALPFLPLAAAALAGDPGELWSVGAYLREGQVTGAGLAGLPRMLWETFVFAPRAALELIAGHAPALKWLLGGMVLALGGLGIVGALAALVTGRHRALILLALAGVLAWTAQVAILRPVTWWYMMLGALPLAGLAWAAGLDALPELLRRRIALPLAGAGALACMLALAASLAGSHDESRSRPFPVWELADLKTPGAPRPSGRVPLMSVRHADELVDFLCASERLLSLHGVLAFQADTLAGILFQSRCGRTPELVLAGHHRQRESLLGLGRAAFAAIAGDPPDPTARIGNLVVVEPGRVLYPSSAIEPASARDYLPRAWTRAPEEETVLGFVLDAGEQLVISRIFHWWAESEVIEVSAGGRPAQRLPGDEIAAVYRCRGCPPDEPAHWRVVLRAPDELPLEVVSLPGERAE